MPFIKNPINILAECAASDIKSTSEIVKESAVRSYYNNIEEAEELVTSSAEMVPVIKIGESYYTETNYLAPFMRDHNIKSIAEALSAVSKANDLDDKDVGLLVEPKECVSSMIEKACKCENSKVKDNVLNKVDKANKLIKNLKDKGYKVKAKKK